MSRTIKEIRVSGRKAEEVKERIALWLAENYFDVKDWDSKGKRLHLFKWSLLAGTIISPCVGSIVAFRMEPYGCVVFEIIIKEEGNDTLVHGEFYAAGAWIFLGRELDLRASSPLAGRWPREEGYKAMTKLIQSLEGLSVKPES